eukprot:SM000070S21353  [mRNA]  locus=s70:615718:620473:+ [translate_table: standard]
MVSAALAGKWSSEFLTSSRRVVIVASSTSSTMMCKLQSTNSSRCSNCSTIQRHYSVHSGSGCDYCLLHVSLLLGTAGRHVLTYYRWCFGRKLPGVNAFINKQQSQMIEKLQVKSMSNKKDCMTRLPKEGLGLAVLNKLEEAERMDKPWKGKCSGTVYMGGETYERHLSIILAAYSRFAHTNPLHPDVFPSISQFEAEVVAMTAALLGGDLAQSGGQVCGNMTSGGTESILMAVKASRDFMRATRNVTNPEMIVAVSAHSAYDKAAQYFGIRLRRTKVGKDYRADVSAMRRLVNRNTILLVGSAPGFPHGVIDPIEASSVCLYPQELSNLALSRGICLHVDCCLGGYVLPFAKRLGYPICSFDFSLPGVTSISVDVHKYGLGPKGTSTVLYRNHELRRSQSGQGACMYHHLQLEAALEASLPELGLQCLPFGENGYMKATKQFMEASRRIAEGIEAIEGLQVLGRPDMTVVAFASMDADIFMINDMMSAKGWNLNALQRPSSLHICVTLQHVDIVDEFLEDLTSSVKSVKASPEAIKHGMAPIYGAAARMPHRGAVRDLLIAYLDSS